MCESEEHFDIDLYLALEDRLTWEQVCRISTAVVVLRDERYEFNEWHRKNHAKLDRLVAEHKERKREGQSKNTDGKHEITLEDYLRERNSNLAKLEELKELLQTHRLAIVEGLGAEEGLLEPDQAELFQELEDIARMQVDRIEAAIAKKFPDESAKLAAE